MKRILLLLALLLCVGCSAKKEETMNGIWKGKLKDPSTTAESATLDMYVSIQDDRFVAIFPAQKGDNAVISYGRLEKEEEVFRLALLTLANDYFSFDGAYFEGSSTIQKNELNWNLTKKDGNPGELEIIIKRIDGQNLSFTKMSEEEIEKETKTLKFSVNYEERNSSIKDLLTLDNPIYDWRKNTNVIRSKTGTLAYDERQKLLEIIKTKGEMYDERAFGMTMNPTKTYEVELSFPGIYSNFWGMTAMTSYTNQNADFLFQYNFPNRLLEFRVISDESEWGGASCYYDFDKEEFIPDLESIMWLKEEEVKIDSGCTIEKVNLYKSIIDDLVQENGLTEEMLEAY